MSDRTRQTWVVASTVVAIVGSFIGSGAAGGTPINEAAGGALAADATLIAPAAPAFGIWSVIYLGLVAYAVWQLLPRQRDADRHRRLGYPIAASLILNAAWILSIQFDQLWLSVPVILALLAVLLWCMRVCVTMRSRSILDGIITDGTVGLYLGWVAVASVANITALLVASGFDGLDIPADAWAVMILSITGIIGVLLGIWTHGRLTPAIALAWGLAWIAVGRWAGEPQSFLAVITAILSAAAILLATIVARWARRTTRPTGDAAA